VGGLAGLELVALVEQLGAVLRLAALSPFTNPL
jgi:hypothetical protein